MNDRFKFRVWNKNTHSFTTGGAIKFGGLCFVDEEDLGIKLGEHQEDYIIEQCTGLKDKNGKLIYEGDVVEDSVYENNFVVSWDNDRTGYILSANNTDHIDYLSKILIERHNLKIIGNIHEQTEQKERNRECTKNLNKSK